jgi:uncharacterized protein (TIGR02266 family)
MPTNWTNSRKFPRARVALLVQYRLNSVEDFSAEYAVDLSPGGIFIATDTPPPVGTLLSLQFSMKTGSKLIEGVGKVVRVAKARGDQPAGMGIEFLQFDAEAIDLITRICEGRPRPK